MKRLSSLLLGTALLAAVALVPSPTVRADAKAQARHLEDAFADVAEQAFPSVVVIRTRRPAPPRGQAGGLPQEFFNLPFQVPRQFEPFHQRRQGPPPMVEGRGSGVIVDAEGHILTNHHVVADNEELLVTLRDGRELPGTLVGTDPKTDLAVVKVEADAPLPFLEFADSDQVRVGQWAIAIGAPFNFDYTMTVGIVSQKGRAVGLNTYENYIQTDASINPGNSGGPLLDLNGKVIGINDFIVSNNGLAPGNVGLGFAIPANMARDVMAQLIAHGEVVRPWIGISMQPLTPELRRQFKAEQGVLVGEVFTDDPADRAGIQPGDVVVRLDGEPVAEPKDVQFGILRHQPGETIRLTILRDGEEREFKVVAGKQQADELAGVPARPDGQPEGRLEDFGLALREEHGRVVVAEVMPDSPAQHAGMKPGNVIYAVNRQDVTSVADARQALAANDRQLLLHVSDGRFKRFLVLERPKPRR
jgi:serine protease Do